MHPFRQRFVVIAAAALAGILVAIAGGDAPEPADALTLALPGAVVKSPSFSIVPPFDPGVSHVVTMGYSTAGHAGIANPWASNDQYALDFDLHLGDPVRAVASGAVAWAGRYPPPSSWSCYGNSVAIAHDGAGSGYVSMYAHMDSLNVSPGAAVKAGDIVGFAGGSGGGTNAGVCPSPFAPHLHFVLYRGANATGHPPLGGNAAVPEPMSFCSKNAGGPCEDLTAGDMITSAPRPVAATPPPVQGISDPPQAVGAPPQFAPDSGVRVDTLAPTLAWPSPPETRQWQLQVSPVSGDGPGLDLVVSGPGGRFDLPAPPQWYGLLPDMTYAWKVRSSASTAGPDGAAPAWGPWSALRTFRTPTATASGIKPARPLNGAEVAGTKPTLVWTDENPGDWLYDVQVSADPAFETDPARAVAAVYSEVRHGGVTDPANSYTVPDSAPLLPGGAYYWRVRPHVQGDGTPVAWSATWRFAVR